MDSQYLYIYNYKQADFFVKNGLPVLEIGKGNRNDIYIKFAKNEKTQEVFDRWKYRCELLR